MTRPCKRRRLGGIFRGRKDAGATRKTSLYSAILKYLKGPEYYLKAEVTFQYETLAV